MRHSQAGFIHIFIMLAVLTVVAVSGVFFLVNSNANSAYNNGKSVGNGVNNANPYTAKCPGNKVKFGAPSGYTVTAESRVKVFGTAQAASGNQKLITFMGHRVTVHSKVAPCLKAVEWDLKYIYKTNYKLDRIYGYAAQSAQNPAHMFHTYGGAVDINPAENHFCNPGPGCTHKLPKSWVRAFEAHGFFWGGNYKYKKDYMHFEWHGQLR